MRQRRREEQAGGDADSSESAGSLSSAEEIELGDPTATATESELDGAATETAGPSSSAPRGAPSKMRAPDKVRLNSQ